LGGNYAPTHFPKEQRSRIVTSASTRIRKRVVFYIIEKLQEILELWVNKFYPNLTSAAEKIHPSINENNFSENGFSENDWMQEIKNRHSLWEIAESARILSAEKRGLRGIENINKMILNILKQKNPFSFNGSLLMLNKNLNFLNLQNGDSGIIVNAKTQPSLMLKRKNDFLFFPLFQLPTDCLQSAFAITIHKSQGSGYKNIMMFLPQYSGHPLLNRQILYTGITRTKKESLTIIASHETFKSAKETLIQRDSGITI
jgi:exodeoxyribonuclease V alpha subunit